jgi:hypothetical protein
MFIFSNFTSIYVHFNPFVSLNCRNFSSEVFGFEPKVKFLNFFLQPNPWRPIFFDKEPPNAQIALQLMPAQWTIPSGRLQYIKNHLKYKIIEQGTQNNKVWCVVTLPKSEKLGIGVIYRPPSVSYKGLSCIENQLENLVPQVDHMIIAGDFNVDYSKQDTLGYKFLKQTLGPYNVTQIINLSTRTTSNTSTITDHIQ